jgi:hypothetical protein
MDMEVQLQGILVGQTAHLDNNQISDRTLIILVIIIIMVEWFQLNLEEVALYHKVVQMEGL